MNECHTILKNSKPALSAHKKYIFVLWKLAQITYGYFFRFFMNQTLILLNNIYISFKILNHLKQKNKNLTLICLTLYFANSPFTQLCNQVHLCSDCRIATFHWIWIQLVDWGKITKLRIWPQFCKGSWKVGFFRLNLDHHVENALAGVSSGPVETRSRKTRYYF